MTIFITFKEFPTQLPPAEWVSFTNSLDESSILDEIDPSEVRDQPVSMEEEAGPIKGHLAKHGIFLDIEPLPDFNERPLMEGDVVVVIHPGESPQETKTMESYCQVLREAIE